MSLKSARVNTFHAQPCLGRFAGQSDNSNTSNTMKQSIIKSIVAVLAIIALVMLVGDLPEASTLVFTVAKVAGFALLLAAIRIWDKNIPEEEV